MATKYFPIPAQAWQPDTVAPPQIVAIKSSAAAPAPQWPGWAFDGTNPEYLHFVFQVPGDYVGSPVIRGKVQTNSTANNTMIMGCRVAAITAGDAETPQEKAAAAVNYSASIQVNVTEANREIEFTITISTTDSLAAGDLVDLILSREPGHASDTHTAIDATFLGGAFEYADA